MEMVQPSPTHALSHARGLSIRTHLTAVGVLPGHVRTTTFQSENEGMLTYNRATRPCESMVLAMVCTFGWESGTDFCVIYTTSA